MTASYNNHIRHKAHSAVIKEQRIPASHSINMVNYKSPNSCIAVVALELAAVQIPVASQIESNKVSKNCLLSDRVLCMSCLLGLCTVWTYPPGVSSVVMSCPPDVSTAAKAAHRCQYSSQGCPPGVSSIVMSCPPDVGTVAICWVNSAPTKGKIDSCNDSHQVTVL
jgi:hypothetical protein